MLVNPHSAGGRTLKLLPEAERELRARSIPYRVVRTRSLDHGIGEAQRAAEAGEVPVVMSGDGLVGQVGGALAESDATMGIIPGGRGNDLARVLGIPADPAGAVAVLADGDTKRIDVGVANGRRFLGVASCGFDSDANRIANEARLIRGNLVYAYAAIRALIAWHPAMFTLILDGGDPISYRGYSVAAGNSRAFGGGMFIAPHAELDDGLLDVVTVSDVGKLRYIRGLPKAFQGTHLDNDEVTERRAATVEIRADRDFAVFADGEHLTDLPATVSVLPEALRVIAPPGPLVGPPS
ncbi:MAG TPA: diacylglycerol kinase family protein [Solirubrobacterales bacterium]|nr:diacylglycerol kinase family protein [Solirubrobacterales bacterium]